MIQHLSPFVKNFWAHRIILLNDREEEGHVEGGQEEGHGEGGLEGEDEFSEEQGALDGQVLSVLGTIILMYTNTSYFSTNVQAAASAGETWEQSLHQLDENDPRHVAYFMAFLEAYFMEVLLDANVSFSSKCVSPDGGA